MESGPQFIFMRSTDIDFNPDRDNLMTVIEQIKNNMDSTFKFSINGQSGNNATGPGANRQVYQILYEELVSRNILVRYRTYFVDINENHEFWYDEKNIDAFARFIVMVKTTSSYLPFHLAPAMLESITQSVMMLDDLEYYMDKYDPNTLQQAMSVSPENFESVVIDYKNHYDYYRSVIVGDVNPDKCLIYNLIGETICMIENILQFSIREVDMCLSGEYEITSSIIKNIMPVEEKYRNLWHQFIDSLDASERKCLLMTFGNTNNTNQKFTIIINDKISRDVNIWTCYHSVTINSKLFENIDTLMGLKKYFNEIDNYINDNDNNDNNNNDDDSDNENDEENDDENNDEENDEENDDENNDEENNDNNNNNNFNLENNNLFMQFTYIIEQMGIENIIMNYNNFEVINNPNNNNEYIINNTNNNIPHDETDNNP